MTSDAIETLYALVGSSAPLSLASAYAAAAFEASSAVIDVDNVSDESAPTVRPESA